MPNELMLMLDRALAAKGATTRFECEDAIQFELEPGHPHSVRLLTSDEMEISAEIGRASMQKQRLMFDDEDRPEDDWSPKPVITWIEEGGRWSFNVRPADGLAVLTVKVPADDSSVQSLAAIDLFDIESGRWRAWLAEDGPLIDAITIITEFVRA